VTLDEALHVEYKEIKIRPIHSFEIDCEDYEDATCNLDVSDTKDTLIDVTLRNLTALKSIDIQTSDIKKLFSQALHVSIKREFKKGSSESDINDIEALSLEEYFLEHIKEESKNEEYDRLKSKIQELFFEYEEVSDDTL
jgi:hypothetical protein